jgi:hypothetical protein
MPTSPIHAFKMPSKQIGRTRRHIFVLKVVRVQVESEILRALTS